MSVKPIGLRGIEREQLLTIVKKGSDWREQERERHRRWLKKGLASLPDQPRCGVSSKLAEAHRSQLKDWGEVPAWPTIAFP